jgi:hypothetical protein
MKAASVRRMYLREAVTVLIMARLAVRFVPSRLLLVWTARPPRRIRRFSGHEADWVSWAVETAGAKPWVKAVCLPRALAAQTMLRRRGIESQLCLGVARKGETLITHAWIEIGQNVIVGGEVRHQFTKLAGFGQLERMKRGSIG